MCVIHPSAKVQVFQVSPHNPRPASGLFGASAHVGAPSKLSKKARPSVGPGAAGPFGAASDVTEGNGFRGQWLVLHQAVNVNMCIYIITEKTLTVNFELVKLFSQYKDSIKIKYVCNYTCNSIICLIVMGFNTTEHLRLERTTKN